MKVRNNERELALALDRVKSFACCECGRVFDMRIALDQEEWAFGHDCEVSE